MRSGTHTTGMHTCFKYILHQFATSQTIIYNFVTIKELCHQDLVVFHLWQQSRLKMGNM